MTRAIPGASPVAIRAPLPRPPEEMFVSLQAGQARSVFLDSAAAGDQARWSYLAAGDLQVLEARQSGFEALAAALAPRARPRVTGLPPFQGGFMGLLSYDLARELERLPGGPPDDLGLPLVAGLLVDEFLAVDHAQREVWAVAVPRTGERDKATEARAAALLERAGRAQPAPVEPHSRPRLHAQSNAGEARYEAMVAEAKRLIEAGDVYQVNLAHRLSWPQTGSALGLYLRLRRVNPSPFAFYLDLGPWQAVSCSPERLVKVEGRRVETRPIAGTYPRPATPAEDAAQATRLRADPKERAEHTMLVDLERNDLGRVCAYGSVRVEELLTTERYSHVVHLVSQVAGTLAPGRSALDAVRACFPGGTITGVPKVRAMQAIDALEPARRAFYTGSVGWIGDDGDADLNIVIRTMLCQNGVVHAPVGAGIVADSDPAKEWRETLHKARALLLAAGVEAP